MSDNQAESSRVPRVGSKTIKAIDLAQRLDMPEVVVALRESYAFKEQGDDLILLDVAGYENSFLRSDRAMYDDEPIKLALDGKNSLSFPPGVTILMGRTGAGKSKLALGHLAAMNRDVLYVRFGEPLDRYFNLAAGIYGDTGEAGIALASFEVDVAQWLADALLRARSPGRAYRAVIVDSLRYLVYGPGGNTGRGGVNMTLFTDLSFLDTVAARAGLSVILVMNPLAVDDADYNRLLDIAAASVAGTIDVTTPTTIRYTSRYLDRDWVTVNLRKVAAPQASAESATGLEIPHPIPRFNQILK